MMADVIVTALLAAVLYFALRGALRAPSCGGCSGDCAHCRYRNK